VDAEAFVSVRHSHCSKYQYAVTVLSIWNWLYKTQARMINIVTKTMTVTMVITVTNFGVLGNEHIHILECASEY